MAEEKKDEKMVISSIAQAGVGAYSYKSFLGNMSGFGASVNTEKARSKLDELDTVFRSIGTSVNREVRYCDYRASAIEEYQAKNPAGLTCFHESYNIDAFKHPPYFMECSELEYREASSELGTCDDPTKKYSNEHRKFLYGHLPETAGAIGHVFTHLLEDVDEPFLSTCVRTINGHERFIVTVWYKGINGEASGYYAHGVWFNIHTPQAEIASTIQ